MAEQIFIVRHGETEWSAAGKHTSVTDLGLTAAGREQAVEVARKLTGHEFGLVLCSPLRRARETCELAGFSAVSELCEDLREWAYGDYEGLTTPEIWERDGDWNLWRDGCPGGEMPADIGVRVDRVLERLRATDGAVLLFAHGHVLRALTARWLTMDVAAGAHFKLAAAAIGTLGYERDTEVIERWSA